MLPVSTAALSAAAGLGGGIVLLAVLLLFLDPLVAIPVHGVIQIVANGSRTVARRRHVDWGIVVRFAAPLLPAGLLGLAIAEVLPVDASRLVLGVFVLVASWFPRLLAPRAGGVFPRDRFVAVGAVAGTLNIPLGTTGPVINPFFHATGLHRQAVVGTFAAAQIAAHVAKSGVFSFDGFAWGDHLGVIAVGSAFVIVGTWIGGRLLDQFSEAAFRRLHLIVITLIAVRLIVQSAIAVLS